jgi:hypothetical protein
LGNGPPLRCYAAYKSDTQISLRSLLYETPQKTTWLKNRGYLHITNQINVNEERGAILGKVKSQEFVSKHAFFPLIHTNIKVRRYKVADGAKLKAHSYQGKTNTKLRPLHYATHIDAMIFGYYGELLQKAYLKELQVIDGLANCVTAYRRIEDPTHKGSYKSTIHFAHEVFEEIRSRSEVGCWVLKFDITKFFSSMDHGLLKRAWAKLIGEAVLPPHHYNVFKAATKFSYILRDDLRLKRTKNGRRMGFDEKHLAEIRKQKVSAFFVDASSFRAALKAGKYKVYKNNFKNSLEQVIGIPQGLPISATLANLYLLEFDKAIYNEVVINYNGFYRRYSDDIIVICNEKEKDFLLNYLKTTLEQNSKVTISSEKTEQHFFKRKQSENGKSSIEGYVLTDGGLLPKHPLTYLGFEFYGEKTLIKSSNLSKFYRRMIQAVKSRLKRAHVSSEINPHEANALFKRRLYRLYTNINLDKKLTTRYFKKLVENRFGYYTYQTEPKKEEFRSNYFSYAKRAASIMHSPSIKQQLRRHRTIFNQAIVKHRKYKI